MKEIIEIMEEKGIEFDAVDGISEGKDAIYIQFIPTFLRNGNESIRIQRTFAIRKLV